ncbi:MAG: anti-sigma factor [Microbacterium sp. SCN 70-27]|uniref:anti-sigma factor n=1 Tax=unclassified Microbacterium TaxID=2609290 RepID=UPI00086ECAA7|nr:MULTISPECIES: anti-sigma factor [unclassified Microbacterium]MBN9224198.1 anti-sigma factor [Microbacterium sp.]ODT27576.1 MAG: anti-sigma factor [Microbacterium sp. SCN 70-27]
MNEQEFAELSAGHALGALSGDDERAFRDALAAHPEWQHIVDLDLRTAGELADAVPPVAAPRRLRASILDTITAEPQPAGVSEPDPADASATTGRAEPAADPGARDEPLPTDVVQTVRGKNWRRGLFALVASFVLLVGVGWGVGAIAALWQTPPAVTALEQIQRAPDASSASADFDGGSATVHWSESLGETVLVADGLPALPSDRTYELWFVRGEQAVAAGTFSASSGTSTAQLEGAMQPGDTIAVTVEPAGGAPDGVPTTTPVLTVPTST